MAALADAGRGSRAAKELANPAVPFGERVTLHAKSTRAAELPRFWNGQLPGRRAKF
jgi:hypothetical protein